MEDYGKEKKNNEFSDTKLKSQNKQRNKQTQNITNKYFEKIRR